MSQHTAHYTLATHCYSVTLHALYTQATHCCSPICIAVCTTFQHSTRYSDLSTGCCPTNRRATPGSGKQNVRSDLLRGPLNGYREFAPGVKRPGRQPDFSRRLLPTLWMNITNRQSPLCHFVALGASLPCEQTVNTLSPYPSENRHTDFEITVVVNN